MEEYLTYEALKKYEITRCDDFVLYAYVCNMMCGQIKNYSFNQALLGHKELGLPEFEKILQIKKELQEKYEELKAKKRRKKSVKKI